MVKVLGISLAESVAELGCLAPYPSVKATGTITASCSKRDELPMAVSTFTHTSLCNSSWRCSWNNTLIAARAKIASCRPCRQRNLLAGQGPRPQSQEKTVANTCKGCSSFFFSPLTFSCDQCPGRARWPFSAETGCHLGTQVCKSNWRKARIIWW